MARLFANNAASVLALSITAGATSIAIRSADAALFPSPTGSDYFALTLDDGLGHVEIVKVTARSGGVLTVVRAQEGTSAYAFSAGALAELRWTAGAATEAVAASGAVMSFGAYANPPSSPSNGDVHRSTDSPLVRYRSGGAWVDYIEPFGRATVPLAADFTSVNIGSAVIEDDGGLVIRETTLGTNHLRGCYVATRAAPYSIHAVFDGPGFQDNYINCGMFLSDGTKFVTFSISNVSAAGTPSITAHRWTDSVTFANEIAFSGLMQNHGRTGLCISDDGVNRNFYVTWGGSRFYLFASTARNDHVGADPVRVGLYLNSDNASWLGSMRVYSFRQVAGGTPAAP